LKTPTSLATPVICEMSPTAKPLNTSPPAIPAVLPLMCQDAPGTKLTLPKLTIDVPNPVNVPTDVPGIATMVEVIEAPMVLPPSTTPSLVIVTVPLLA
jgi:hypothetical protein